MRSHNKSNDFFVPDCSPFTGPRKFVGNIIKNNYMYAKSILMSYLILHILHNISKRIYLKFSIYYLLLKLAGKRKSLFTYQFTVEPMCRRGGMGGRVEEFQ
jgi:hypothetical protein